MSFHAFIAYPTRQPGNLVREIVTSFGRPTSDVRHEINPLPWKKGEEWHGSLSIPVGASRSPVFVFGYDDAYAEAGHFSIPDPMRTGVWAYASFESQDKAAAVKLATDHASTFGGFITFDGKHWDSLNDDCSYSFIDRTKYRLLEQIGFQHANAVEVMIRKTETLDMVSALMQIEVALRYTDPAPTNAQPTHFAR